MKQVDSSHYSFSNYVSIFRWESIWYQANETLEAGARRILEVGPGPGLFKAVIESLGLEVKTLDPEPDLNPDYLGSICDIPVSDNTFDTVCAFQVLEHMPFENSLIGFQELCRVSSKNIIISLPDNQKVFSIHVQLSGLSRKTACVPLIKELRRFRSNGEHCWEINIKGYDAQKVVQKFLSSANVELLKHYRIPENPYHRMFVFRKLESLQI